MIRLREDNFERSMKRAVHVYDIDDVLAYLRCHVPKLAARKQNIAQRHYGRDARNEWDSWLITHGLQPVLWADGPIAGVPALPPLAIAR